MDEAKRSRLSPRVTRQLSYRDGTGDEDDTFRQKVVIKHLDAAIGSMSISPANRDIVLGARTGLYIVDLANAWDMPRFLPGLSTWEVADVQWNIHPARAHWIVSTSGHQALVWNLVMQPSPSTRNSSVEFILTGHRRSVTDINWSVFEPERVATCALDGWVQTWDLRTAKRPIGSYSGWRMGATQVKWNRQDQHLLASAHDGQVLIWDTRNGSIPVATIDAHETKIYGLDWSRTRPDELITCSLDRTVKSWQLSRLDRPESVFVTDSPVWRARHTPFGDGILSLPQRAHTALTLWNTSGEALHRFEGHKSVCKEFVWRTRGGQDPSSDDRDFQLVTWGRDCELHLWPISRDVLEKAGHRRGAPIAVRMTRRHYENISYRQPEDLLNNTGKASPSQIMKPAPGLSPMTTRGHVKQNSNASISPASTTDDHSSLPPLSRHNTTVESIKSERIPTSFTIRGPQARGQENNPIAWLNRITAGHTQEADEDRTSGGQGGDRVDPEKHSLGEEIAAAGRKHANRINFEKVQVGNRRCIVSCYGPWSSTNALCFIRVHFQFPPRYPQARALRGDVISDVTHKTRAAMQRGLRIIANSCARTATPAFEACLRYLLGEKTEHDKSWSDSSSSEEEDDPVGPAAKVRPVRYNVPIPRQCGASFGPHDEMVLFFARPLKVGNGGGFLAIEPSRKPSNSPAPPRPGTGQLASEGTDLFVPKKRRRVFESFGVLPIEGGPEEAANGSESDDVLRFCGATKASRSKDRRDLLERSEGLPPEPSRMPFSTTIHFRHTDSLTWMQSQLVPDFPVFGEPHILCLQNVMTCRKYKQEFQALVWTTMAEMMAPVTAQAKSRHRQLVHSSRSMAEKTLEEMLALLRAMRDVHTLGLIACCLELKRRHFFVERRKEQATPSRSREVHTVLSLDRAPLVQTPDVRTPGDRPLTPYSDIGERGNQGSAFSRTTGASWSSLGAFLSSASLSLSKAGTYTSGSSPTHRSRQATNEDVVTSPTPHRPRRASTSVTNLASELNTILPKISKASTPPIVFKKAPRPPARAGISVTFGATSVIAPGSNVSDHSSPPRTQARRSVRVRMDISEHEDIQRLSPFLRSASMQAELEIHRLAYAELLGRWGYSVRRVEVLSLTIAASVERVGHADTLGRQCLRDEAGSDSYTSLAWSHACKQCGCLLKPPAYAWCDRCQLSRSRERCIVCHQPINGIMRSCLACLHSGHAQCLEEWHQAASVCASGCGCVCDTAERPSRTGLPSASALVVSVK